MNTEQGIGMVKTRIQSGIAILPVLFIALLFLISFASLSSAQIYPKLLDGYVLNVTQAPFSGVNVSFTVTGGCNTPTGCSGSYISEPPGPTKGYYLLSNINCVAGWTIVATATYPGGYHGTISVPCVDSSTPLHHNITIGIDPYPPVLNHQPDTHQQSVTLSWTSNGTRGQPAPNSGPSNDNYKFNGNWIYNTTPTKTQGSLSMFGAYTWGVQSCDIFGFCSALVTETFHIVNKKPDSPVLVPQSNTHDTNVSLSWTSNTTRHETDADGDPVYDQFFWGGVWTNATPAQLESGLTMGTTYSWGAQTCDPFECSDPVYSSFKIQNLAPPAPNLTDVPHTQLTTITFNWENYSDPEGDSTYNQFQLATDASFATIIDSDNNATSPITFGPLPVFTLYYWRVKTCDSFNQCSNWSTDSFFVYQCAACPPPSGGGTCPTCPDCAPSETQCPVCTPPTPACTPSWQCGDWSTCNEEGLSFRECGDASSCAPGMPSQKQSCSYTVPQCEANVTVIEKEKIVEQPVVVQEIQKIFQKQLENLTTSITNESVKISSLVSCDPQWAGRVNPVDESGFNIPSDSTIIINPFKVDCIGSNAMITVNVPDKFANVKALRCDSSKQCVEVPLAKFDAYTCPVSVSAEQINRLAASDTLQNIPTKTVTLNAVENAVAVNGYKAQFSNIGKLALTMKKGNELLPDSTNLKMISGQLELNFIDLPNANTTISVTMPYIKRNIDENTVAIYVKNIKKGGYSWDLLKGTVNTDQKTVSVDITNPNNYMGVQKKIVLAVFAVNCANCEGVTLQNVYNPIPLTKDGVILVHGFGSSPATFDPLISDIKLTNQPWQLWTFGYPTDGSIDFSTLAMRLADKIEEQSDNFDSIYIVAHSMGGLVTQKAVRYAYEQNKIRNGRYTFVNKVKKIVLIGSPNKGTPGAQVYEHLAEYLHITQAQSAAALQQKRDITSILTKGVNVPRVPGVNYYVIAGTKPYDVVSGNLFGDQPNDGVVSVDSATYVGGEYINNLCSNFWQIATDHNDILKNPVARKIIGKIISTQIAGAIGSSDLFGMTSFYGLNDTRCSAGATYMVVGTQVIPQKEADITGCSCGNGYCGEGENEVNCPSDCANVFREENLCVILLFIIMFASILFSIFLVISVHRMYSLNAFSNIAIVPLIFIIISIISMMLYVTRACYVVFIYRMLVIIISVISIALATVIVAIIVIKQKVRMYLLKLKRKDDLKRLEEYIFNSIKRNDEIIQKKLMRVGWRTEDIAYIVHKVKRKTK